MPKMVLPPGGPSLADAVITAVRNGVAGGDLLPTQTYSVYQLAAVLGVSRSPVREAITRLADAGLVEIYPNRGFRVIVPTAHDLGEIIEIRLALEPTAARRAAEIAGEGQRTAVRVAYEAMVVAVRRNDETAFWPADRDLHDVLLRASGNARAAAIVAQLRATTALLGPPTTVTGRTLEQILAEHEPVVTAVLTGDGVAAEAEMRSHLAATGHILLRNFEHGQVDSLNT